MSQNSQHQALPTAQAAPISVPHSIEALHARIRLLDTAPKAQLKPSQYLLSDLGYLTKSLSEAQIRHAMLLTRITYLLSTHLAIEDAPSALAKMLGKTATDPIPANNPALERYRNTMQTIINDIERAETEVAQWKKRLETLSGLAIQTWQATIVTNTSDV